MQGGEEQTTKGLPMCAGQWPLGLSVGRQHTAAILTQDMLHEGTLQAHHSVHVFVNLQLSRRANKQPVYSHQGHSCHFREDSAGLRLRRFVHQKWRAMLPHTVALQIRILLVFSCQSDPLSGHV